MAAPVPLERISTRLKTVINNLGDLPPPEPGKAPDPYLADAKAFATQAKVCVDKQIETNGSLEPKKGK
jgi:hypothetical protein